MLGGAFVEPWGGDVRQLHGGRRGGQQYGGLLCRFYTAALPGAQAQHLLTHRLIPGPEEKVLAIGIEGCDRAFKPLNPVRDALQISRNVAAFVFATARVEFQIRQLLLRVFRTQLN